MVDQPQIILIGESSWTMRGPYSSDSALLSVSPVPDADCPRLDISLIADVDLLRGLIRRHMRPDGVQDVDVLIAELLRIGAMYYKEGETSVQDA